MPSARALPRDYPKLLDEIKERIRNARVKAALSVNCELIRLYWQIGRSIAERQKREGWGTKVIDVLADDLRAEFPGEVGFSRTNIYRMRGFYLACLEQSAIVPQAVGHVSLPLVPQPVGQIDGPPAELLRIPWGHNVVLIEKVEHADHRLWYAQQTVAHGWSRAVLVHQIESDAFARQGKALTSFQTTLPSPQSDLAQQITKDPYFTRVMVRRILRKYGYPPDLQAEATKLVLEQAEVLCNDWAA